MKIIRYISMIISLCRKFMPMQNRVIVCGCDYPESGCLLKDLRIFSHLSQPAALNPACFAFEYASDLIWMLGKNNLDSSGICR
jgi:hypothetical protein